MVPTEFETDQVREPLRPNAWVLAGYAALIAAVAVGFGLGGWAATFALVGLIFIPFVLLAVLAYLGLRYLPARILALFTMVLLFGAFIFQSISLGLTATADLETLAGGVLDPEVAAVAGRIGGMAIVSVLFACLGFLPPVRRAISRLLPIDPDSFVHTVALVTVVALLLMSFVPLLVLGEPPALSETALDQVEQSGFTGEEGLLFQVFTLIWSVPIAIFVVGYGIRRSLREALQRLGLVRPTLIQMGIGIGVAILLVFVSSLLQAGISWFWQVMGWPMTDVEAFNELAAFAFSPLGAVLVGISAGLGEELAVRGVLQPRLGILLSNLFFTALHAFQYSWDALLVVFLLGTFFGVLRRYTNTTTSAVAHGLYDFFVIMMAVYGISFFQ